MIRFSITSLLVLAASSTHAEPVAPGDTAIETFTPPVRIQAKAPTYPFARRRSATEGWVAVNFMVDPKGAPYDITVNTSSGDEAFERAAVRAVEKWRYEPAVFQGQPIDAGQAARITFQLSGEAGATEKFVKAWQWYQKGKEQNDAERMARNFERMENTNRNLYEEAYYQLLLSDRYRESGDLDAEYAAVTRAAFLDNNVGYLPDDALTSVLLRKMSLELQLNKLVRAHKTILALQQRELEEDLAAQLEDIAASIMSAAEADGVIKSNGRIRSDNRYVHQLLKTSFVLDEINGDIAEARLHCDRGYVGFIYREEMRYTIKDGWSNCALILIGDPDTTFVLVES